MSALAVVADRCVHQRVVGAACSNCIAACPQKAWRMRDSGLGLDAEACDDCGLCVAACPTEALTLPAPVFLIRREANTIRAGLIACCRADISSSSGATAGHVPCLYALTPGWLWQQADAQQLGRIVATTGDCALCPCGSARSFWYQQWTAVAEMRANERLAPELEIVAPHIWQALADSAAETESPRRAFFRRLADPAISRSSDAPLSSRRQWLVLRHGDSCSAPLWAVALSDARCNACLACTRLCPTEALRVEMSDMSGDDQLVIDMARCIGCGLCVAGCDSSALTLISEGAPSNAMSRLPLRQQLCHACNTPFYHLSLSAAATEKPLCFVCGQGRLAKGDRIVQT